MTQPKVVVYSKAYCPYCAAAKELLAAKGVVFEEIDVTNDEKKVSELVKRTKHQTVPQIFIGERFVGGYQELEALDDSGKLDQLLK